MASPAEWIEGARLRTLPLALAPIVAGSVAAAELHSFRPVRAALALLVAFFLQVGVNYANDYSDGVKGTDEGRVGPMRLVGSGAASPKAVKFAAFLCFGLAVCSGVLLVALANQWWFLAVGASALFAAWGYTGGKRPYGYMGLGDVFVFIYFGLVATLGTLFTQTNQLTLTGWVGAVAVGMISCALLMANNVRDIPTDSESGKLTLAVRLGDRAARITYAVEMILAILLCTVLVPQNPWFALIFVLVGPTVYSCVTVLSGRTGKDLIPVLKQAGIVALAYSLLMGLAVFLGNFNSLS